MFYNMVLYSAPYGGTHKNRLTITYINIETMLSKDCQLQKHFDLDKSWHENYGVFNS